MGTTLIVTSTLLICLSSVIKSSKCASVDRNWSKTFLAAGRTASSTFGDDEDVDDWQPAVRPQNWLITTSATVPLTLTSSRQGERERISLMFERQQEKNENFLPKRYYGYSQRNGSYVKRQTTSLLSSSSHAYEQPLQTTANKQLKPYVVASSRDTNIDINASYDPNPTYRRHNLRKHYPLSEGPFVEIVNESGASSQSERHMDGYQHFRAPHTYNDNNMMSTDWIESHIINNPTESSSAKESSAAMNVNIKQNPSPPTLTTATSSTAFNNNIDDGNVNEILLPLHAALDTVKQFCDYIKEIITDDRDDKENKDDNAERGVDDDTETEEKEEDEEGDEEEEEDEIDNKTSSTEDNASLYNDTDPVSLSSVLTAVSALLMKTPLLDLSNAIAPTSTSEVHGPMDHINIKQDPLSSMTRSLPTPGALHALSSTSDQEASQQSADAVTGRARRLRRRKVRLPHIFGHHGRVKRRKAKRRIRRKFKKYIFPLLIAYKLLFLALIPLLVGGLTLLVGSTGMAGFFFALFAAVMTIRRGRAAAGDGGGGDARSSAVNYF